jgi:sigma-B regulation protein RsbU (phosphoserine phosphatase)
MRTKHLTGAQPSAGADAAEPPDPLARAPALLAAGLALGLGAALIAAAVSAGDRGRLVVAALAATAAALGLGLWAVARWFVPAIERVRRGICAARERQIARHLRSSLRPRAADPAMLELAAESLLSDELGGDCYDVIDTPQGTWIAMGEVGGQGLRTGLITLMIQSVFGALVASRATARPAELLQVLGRVLIENVRRRLRMEVSVRLTLCHVAHDGAFTYAGADQDFLICRATGKIEHRIPTGPLSGPLGKSAPLDTTLMLAPGDLVLLYTRGAVEARGSAGERFGVTRLGEALRASRHATAADIGAQLAAAIASFAPRRQEEATFLVLRGKAI